MSRKARPVADRFWSKVEKTDTCWLWMAGLNDKGYGRFWNSVRTVYAHRWAYEQVTGPISEGLELDHLCRVRNCVNPDHLEPVTTRENAHRGLTLQATNSAKTHCPRGHGYTPDNTKVRRNGSGALSRHCRACDVIHCREYRARRKAAA